MGGSRGQDFGNRRLRNPLCFYSALHQGFRETQDIGHSRGNFVADSWLALSFLIGP